MTAPDRPEPGILQAPRETCPNRPVWESRESSLARLRPARRPARRGHRPARRGATPRRCVFALTNATACSCWLRMERDENHVAKNAPAIAPAAVHRPRAREAEGRLGTERVRVLRVPLAHKLLPDRRNFSIAALAKPPTTECGGYLSHLTHAAQVKMRMQRVTFPSLLARAERIACPGAPAASLRKSPRWRNRPGPTPALWESWPGAARVHSRNSSACLLGGS